MHDDEIRNKNCSTKINLIRISERTSEVDIMHWWGIADHQSAICHYVVANFSWWCLRRLSTKQICYAW